MEYVLVIARYRVQYGQYFPSSKIFCGVIFRAFRRGKQKQKNFERGKYVHIVRGTLP